jgi:hypothetical protein
MQYCGHVLPTEIQRKQYVHFLQFPLYLTYCHMTSSKLPRLSVLSRSVVLKSRFKRMTHNFCNIIIVAIDIKHFSCGPQRDVKYPISYI